MAFGLIAAAVTTVAIIESYGNLYDFLQAHGVHGWRAAIGPLVADAFIILGELLLFSALLRRWVPRAPYILGGFMAVWGFVLSVGGNVWHVVPSDPVNMAVSAIWPVTATFGMAGALIIVKQLISDHAEPDSGSLTEPVTEPVTEPAAVPVTGTPLPAPDSPVRERRTSAGRQARKPALAAAKAAAEAELTEWLAGLAELPTVRGLAAHELLAGHGSLATRRRAAERLIEKVKDGRLIAEAAGLRDSLIASANGARHGDSDGS